MANLVDIVGQMCIIVTTISLTCAVVLSTINLFK